MGDGMNTDYGSYEIPFSLSGKRASFHFAMALAHVWRWRTFERHGPPTFRPAGGDWSDWGESLGQIGFQVETIEHVASCLPKLTKQVFLILTHNVVKTMVPF